METSTIKIDELEQKIIMVAGGAGIVGENIVKVLLANGAIVVVPSLSEEVLCRLRDRMGDNRRLYTPLANTSTLAGARELLSWLKVELGAPDAVIACFSEWWEGVSLVDVSLDTWHKHLERNLTAHFIFAKIFLPSLFERPGSSYLFVNNLTGKIVQSAAGPAAINAAGEIMLKDILTLENREREVRINSLLINAPCPDVKNGGVIKADPSVEEMGTYCAYLVSEKARKIRGETILFEDSQQLIRALA